MIDPSKWRRSLAAALAGLAGAFWLALALFTQSAGALPTYAEKERKPCGFCHVNPEGGSVLNAVGKQYEANGHTFKK